MKKYLFLLIIILTSFFYSCKNELDVTDEWSENTIVYGVLNTSDSIHYLRISKAFLGDGDNNVFAQNPDSSQYHGELEVKIEEWAGSKKIQVFILDTITTYNKVSGSFYSPKQILYYFKYNLKQGYKYKLEVKNKKTGNIVSSESTALSNIPNSNGGDYIKLNIPKTFFLNWDIDPQYNFNIYFNPSSNGAITQIYLNFYYKEIQSSDTIIKNIGEFEIIKNIGTNIYHEEENQIVVKKSGQYFYDKIAEKIEMPTSNTKRSAYQIEIIAYTGDKHFKNYHESINNTSGLNSDKNIYTNIKNGGGIFTIVNKFSHKFYVTPYKTASFIKSNYATKNLGFYMPTTIP